MIYFDSNYLARLYLDDPGWQTVRTLATRAPLACCRHGQAEVITALHRKLREGIFTPIQYRQVLEQFALDCDGNPVIAYYDMKKKSLMNAQRMWPRTEFINWPIGIPASLSADDTGGYVSLAIDRNDHRHISFYDAKEKSLNYYMLDGSQIRILTVDSGNAGRYASLALDSSGQPHIAYYHAADNTIRYASLNG